MWEPSGPLPATVYWRRRWVALASVVVLFALLGLTIAAVVHGKSEATSDEPTTLAANQAALSTEAVPSTVAASSTPGDPTAFGVPSVPLDPSAPLGPGLPGVTTGPGTQVVPSVGAPTTAPATDEVRVEGTPDPAAVDAPPPATVPPTGPVPCTNEMLSVGATIDRSDHKVGDRPVVGVVVTNTSGQPCVRDLDGSRLEIVVWSGDGVNRLWSSNDCMNPSKPDLRTLVPGQPVSFSVTWQGRTSTPGCATARTVVPAGAYRLLTRIDDLISPPTPFLLTP
ncbi:hypothetical protein [Pseudonocardia sp. N23]|uniref:hypothetical protein n=1 Tax=Pseudonocardia sp. N23 TaxID=1987376 RepID=UPI000BFE10E5|nr:hypothetical protein [Pseudonocardia sp. N23]GAY08739.1 hypothetical protein TOK_2695 [Pseudonocardia sp. N23]